MEMNELERERVSSAERLRRPSGCQGKSIANFFPLLMLGFGSFYLTVPQLVLAAPESSNHARIKNVYAAADSRESFAVYHDSKTNLSFDYPRSWHAQPDKDCLVKLAGTTGEGTYGEVKLGLHENVSNPDLVENVLISSLSKALPEYRQISNDQVRFGNRLQYVGKEALISFRVGETVMNQRMVLFPAGNNVAALSFLTQTDNYQKMVPTFDRMLASLNGSQLASQSNVERASTGSTAGWKLVPYTDKSKIISFLYPEGWEMHTNDPAKDLDIKLVGKNSQGMAAELGVVAMPKPPGMSLDQFVATYEENYLKRLKDYHKLSSRPATIGLSHNEGILHICAAEADGHKLRQNAAFFADGSRYYAITLTSAYWKEPVVEDLFQRVLSSVKTAE